MSSSGKGNNYQVVVGIDFGSSGMGYAFSYFDQENIQLSKLQGSGSDSKVPTEVILKGDKVVAFGAACDTHLKNQGNDPGDYFKRIKMNLYSKTKTITSQNTGRKCEVKYIIAKILEALKNDAIKTIKEQRPNIGLEQIKWVLTVPAIWDLPAKNIMIDSARQAGLIDDKTDLSCLLALEPEAASFYCKHCQGFDQNFMKEGREYIVCDLGGGTADIVAHEIGNDFNVSETAIPTGGNFGSDEINKMFIDCVIGKLFGIRNVDEYTNKMKQFCEENEEEYDQSDISSSWIEFERQIDLFKTSLNPQNKGNSYFINCKMFEDIISGDDLQNNLESFNSNCREGWTLTKKR